MGLFTKKLTIEYIQEYLREQGIWATRDQENLLFKVRGVNMRLFYDGRLYIEAQWHHLLDDPTAMMFEINRVNTEHLFVKGCLYRDKEAKENDEKAWITRFSSEMICSSREDFRTIFSIASRQIIDAAEQAHRGYDEFMECANRIIAPASQIGFVQESTAEGTSSEATPVPAAPSETARPQTENAHRRKIGF